MKHKTEWFLKAPRQGLLLDIGSDPALHRARAAALEKQWNIISASPDKAWETFTDNDCDLAVVCQSVPASERQKLVRQIAQRSPSTPILVVAEARNASVAPAIAIDDDPEQLAETVQHHLDAQQRGRTLRKA